MSLSLYLLILRNWSCVFACTWCSVQGRLFSYPDTHRHRLGANYLQLSVNCPYRARVANYQRDGPMCMTDNQGEKFSHTAMSPLVLHARAQDHVLAVHMCLYGQMSKLSATHLHTSQLSVPAPLHWTDNARFFTGGAPNYYPNSFSAADCQPRCMESKFRVSPDVGRYNSSDEDNVTQVWMGHMDKWYCGGLVGGVD